jgi:hypothetical protein
MTGEIEKDDTMCKSTLLPKYSAFLRDSIRFQNKEELDPRITFSTISESSIFVELKETEDDDDSFAEIDNNLYSTTRIKHITNDMIQTRVFKGVSTLRLPGGNITFIPPSIIIIYENHEYLPPSNNF